MATNDMARARLGGQQRAGVVADAMGHVENGSGSHAPKQAPEPYPNARAEFTDAAAAIYCPSCHRWDGTHGPDCPDDTADRPAILLLAKMKRPVGTLYLLTEEGASVETVYTVIVSECGTVMECHPCDSYTCAHVDFVADLGEGSSNAR